MDIEDGTEEHRMGAGIKSASVPMVDADVDNDIAVVQLYDPPSCLRCSHLLSLDEETIEDYELSLREPLLVRTNCHYTHGNLLCPARSLKIAKYVDIDKAVNVYLEVLASDDPKRLASYMAHVGSKDKRTSQLIMERIKALTNTNPDTSSVSSNESVGDSIEPPTLGGVEKLESDCQSDTTPHILQYKV